MRNYLIYFVSAFALLITACETPEVPDTSVAEPKLELTSNDRLRVEKRGGNFEITYILDNVADNAVVKATIVNSAMITEADTKVRGVVSIAISENPTDELREGAVVVSYGALSFTVIIEQTGEAAIERVDIVANQLVGSYYGDNLAEGVGHYWIILTKDGFVDGSVVVDGEYFRLDILAPMPANGEDVTIPDGDYRFDRTLAYEPFTIIDINNTDYTWVDENMDGWAIPFDNATMSVKGSHLELVVLVGNTEFHVSFSGDYSLSSTIITDHVSSLTQDTVIDVSNCKATVSNFGDYWHCGYNNWCIEFTCLDGLKYGTYVVIDYLSSSTTDFTGTFVASGFSEEDATMPDFRANVFIPGFRVSEDADLLLGSLFMVYRDGMCVSQAPIYEGTVTITPNSDGTHAIVIDALDDAPQQNKITLTWTGNFL